MRRERRNFFSFLSFSSFFLLPYLSLTLLLESDRNSPHSLSVTLFLLSLIIFILSFLSNLPCHFTPWLVREGEGVTGMDTLTDISATLYLVSLFTFIYLQTFHPLPSSSTSILLFCNRTRSNVLGELKG
jgi:nitric oxide reductase large subunit